jgi:hypothetical protein
MIVLNLTVSILSAAYACSMQHLAVLLAQPKPERPVTGM